MLNYGSSYSVSNYAPTSNTPATLALPSTVSIPSRSGAFPGSNNQFVRHAKHVYLAEAHMTVIRKGPTMPLSVEMFLFEDNIQTGSSYDNNEIRVQTSFQGSPPASPPNSYGLGNPIYVADDGNAISIFFKTDKSRKIIGDLVDLPIQYTLLQMDWKVDDILVIELVHIDHLNKMTTSVCRAQITSFSTGSKVEVKILAITKNFPIDAISNSSVYTVRLESKPALFEFKFPQFSYRYKYEDGEYSVFAPWSEIAFIPGTFDYMPKKGYNLGMVNNVRSLKLRDWRPKNTPEDVVSIDLLYKESTSPNVYTVQTFEKDTKSTSASNNGGTTPAYQNWWTNEAAAKGNGDNFGEYTITSELIHKVLPSNQMLRPWDNVPRKALAQEITANRLIFANYVQNYNLRALDGSLVQPEFSVVLDSVDYSIDGPSYNKPKEPMKSLKSMRTYQIGVVYADRYGRETPVLTHDSGSIKLPKNKAKLKNTLSISLLGEAPNWAESYTFYIKETSNEYYNVAMDRWYDAEDDTVWISFPSSERNKITDRSILILKKEHNTDRYVDSDNKYKVLDIKSEAPEFIKTAYKSWGSAAMMLPPPGWGTADKPGTWDTGMFHLTGLPLPMRLYIDVYAKYFSETVLAGLDSQTNANGVQIRVTQTIGVPSAYSASPSDRVNKSNWYDVANMAKIGPEPVMQMVEKKDANGNIIEVEEEVPGQQEQLIRISLEQLMGNDMAFCIPTDNLSLSRGLALEARTKFVRNKSEFQGRFFVKILRDEALQAHVIEPDQLDLKDTYQVLLSRGIKYIQFGSPGVQDYLTGATGTRGAGKGKFYNNFDHTGAAVPMNYVPIGKNFDLIPSSHFGTKYEYASLTGNHENAAYVSTGSGFGNTQHGKFTPTLATPWTSSGNFFPWGPSYATNNKLTQGYWYQRYYDVINKNTAIAYATHVAANAPGTANYPTYTTPIVPNVSPRKNGWPSHLWADWEPTSCFDCTTLNAYNFTTGNISTLLNLSQANINPNNTAIYFNLLEGANQYLMGAVWGDQSDLLGYPGNPNTMIPWIPPTSTNTPWTSGVPGANNNLSSPSYTTTTVVSNSSMPSTAVGPSPLGHQSMWRKDTIEKIRNGWYYLFYGKDEVDPFWPLGRHDTQRWFIDKVSAAKGGSGNGIWTHTEGSTTVSKMDVSYYGIGLRDSTAHRSFELLAYQAEEAAFAEAMSTIGTQFRFKQDPNQTVYTITDAKIYEGEIFNFETSYGSWKSVDDTGADVSGGGNMGGGFNPPWGSNRHGQRTLAAKAAFVSDLFNVGNPNTGGAIYNYRARVTITLDKEIGSEGPKYGSANTGFHPLNNHVDEAGNCNIVGYGIAGDGRQRYSSFKNVSWTSSISNPKSFAEEYGGVPNNKRYYNLSSYWNTTTGGVLANVDPNPNLVITTGLNSTQVGNLVGIDQSKLMNNAAYAAGQHFGLHERGLNETVIEIITPYRGGDVGKDQSSNPGIWETEPMEDVGLDIYYAASPSYPIDINRFRSDEDRPDAPDYLNTTTLSKAHYYDYGYRGEEIIPVGCQVQQNIANPYALTDHYVVGVQGNSIWVDSAFGTLLNVGQTVRFYWNGEGFYYGGSCDIQYLEAIVDTVHTNGINFTIKSNSHKYKRSLDYFNCYTFSNGVESNRVRDDYNAIQISKGVKASMPLAQGYKEERKSSGLIFSGIYNSTSGINETNQFIQAEPITKDLNPTNGSIQKLYARDTDLVTFCENKVFRILANKDALFNADGNTNITSTRAVLGTATPFTGEYGISKNPESFAAESYRAYFTDQIRGSVLRLSRDGITPISDVGMKDWFKDNFYDAKKLIGSYDERDNEYNLTVETIDQKTQNDIAYTLSYTETSKGWVSFKSFATEQGLSHKNVYYTFPSNKFSRLTNVPDPWGIFYGNALSANAEVYQHHIDLRIERAIASAAIGINTITVASGVTPILPGMNVTGNGINTGTMVETVSPMPHLQAASVSVVVTLCDTVGSNKNCYVDSGEVLEFTSSRNNFYEVPHYSQVKTLFGGDASMVKRFRTLSYEGSQTKVIPTGGSTNTSNFNSIYDDNNMMFNTGIKSIDDYAKDGWYVDSMETDMQNGRLGEFVNKENKWFNYIRGTGGLSGNKLDTSDFSLQGLGHASTFSTSGTIVTLTFTSVNVSCQVGDLVYCAKSVSGISGLNSFSAGSVDTKPKIMGVVATIDASDPALFITVQTSGYTIPDLSINTPVFMFEKDKNAGISGITGYYALAEFRNYATVPIELFATTVDYAESSK